MSNKINSIDLYDKRILLIGLVTLLISNFVLRFLFEMHMQPVPYYFEQLKLNTDGAWYTYLLPNNAKAWGGTLASLCIGVLPILHKAIGNTTTYLLLNLIFISIAYILSWQAFHSKILTFTVGLCTAFTTLNDHVYDNGSLVGLYFPLIYCCLNMFALLKLFESDEPRMRWWGLWGLSLLLYIASLENWVEYYAIILVLAPACFILLKKRQDSIRTIRLVLILSIMTIAFAVYLYIKFKYAYASHPGEEHDLVFNYGFHYPLLIVEDVIGNLFSFFYSTIITYIPSQLTFSNALMRYGAQPIMDLQNGYDPTHAHIAVINSATIWRFYAGIFLAVFCYYFWEVCKNLFTCFNKDYLYLFIFMSMILIGTPAHILVKFRSFHIVPWLPYQAFIGQIGLILLISYGLFMLHRSSNSKKLIWIVSILVWSSIVVSSFTKHSFYNAGRAYGYIQKCNKCIN